MKDIEQEINEVVRVLPVEKQAKVLEFAETLQKEAEAANGTGTQVDAEAKARHEGRMKLVGIGRSKSGNVSERVDEILAEGINKREGWSLP
ncbi:MAG: hypothetical protein ACR2F2_09850 [Pyrinomonadaceae bacterium]